MTQQLNELAWVPKPFMSDLEWAVADALVNDPNLQRNLKDVTVDLESIEPTQYRLDHGKVRQLNMQGKFDGGLGFSRDIGVATNVDPSADSLKMFSNDVHVWLYDGHHRLAAAKMAGKDSITIKVFNLTDDSLSFDGMSLEDFAAQLQVGPSEILAAMSTDDRRRFEAPLNESDDWEEMRKRYTGKYVSGDGVEGLVTDVCRDRWGYCLKIKTPAGLVDALPDKVRLLESMDSLLEQFK